jgi:hypothetical protein
MGVNGGRSAARRALGVASTVLVLALCLTALGAPSAAQAHGRQHLTYAKIKEYRQKEGLDLDLAGHPKEIAARIRGLLEAWRKGEHWARSTASVWGAPLRKADLKLMSFRQTVLRNWDTRFEAWLARHPEAATTYAGYYVNPENGGYIFIGFTSEQSARVAEMKSQMKLLAPGLIRPFTYQPSYTEAELQGLMEEITGEESLWKDMSTIGVDAEHNKVSIMSTKIAKLRAEIVAKFGPGLPLEFEYGEVVLL